MDTGQTNSTNISNEKNTLDDVEYQVSAEPSNLDDASTEPDSVVGGTLKDLVEFYQKSVVDQAAQSTLESAQEQSDKQSEVVPDYVLDTKENIAHIAESAKETGDLLVEPVIDNTLNAKEIVSPIIESAKDECANLTETMMNDVHIGKESEIPKDQEAFQVQGTNLTDIEMQYAYSSKDSFSPTNQTTQGQTETEMDYAHNKNESIVPNLESTQKEDAHPAEILIEYPQSSKDGLPFADDLPMKDGANLLDTMMEYAHDAKERISPLIDLAKEEGTHLTEIVMDCAHNAKDNVAPIFDSVQEESAHITETRKNNVCSAEEDFDGDYVHVDSAGLVEGVGRSKKDTAPEQIISTEHVDQTSVGVVGGFSDFVHSLKDKADDLYEDFTGKEDGKSNEPNQPHLDEKQSNDLINIDDLNDETKSGTSSQPSAKPEFDNLPKSTPTSISDNSNNGREPIPGWEDIPPEYFNYEKNIHNEGQKIMRDVPTGVPEGKSLNILPGPAAEEPMVMATAFLTYNRDPESATVHLEHAPFTPAVPRESTQIFAKAPSGRNAESEEAEWMDEEAFSAQHHDRQHQIPQLSSESHPAPNPFDREYTSTASPPSAPFTMMQHEPGPPGMPHTAGVAYPTYGREDMHQMSQSADMREQQYEGNENFVPADHETAEAQLIAELRDLSSDNIVHPATLGIQNTEPSPFEDEEPRPPTPPKPREDSEDFDDEAEPSEEPPVLELRPPCRPKLSVTMPGGVLIHREIYNWRNVDPYFFDIIYWSNPVKSGLIFASALLFLFLLRIFPLVQLVAYLSLMILMTTFSYRICSALLAAVKKNRDANPFSKQLMKPVELPNEKIHDHANILMAHLGDLIVLMKRLILVDNYCDTLKFAALLWLEIILGRWFSGLTLLMIGVVAIFTLPKLYQSRQAEIDRHLEVANEHYTAACSKVKQRMPSFLESKNE